MSWKDQANKEMNNPKWVQSGTVVFVEPKPEPELVEIEGKFGKRKVYIISTQEYGLIYVSPNQFCKIANRMAAAQFAKAVSVTL